jgi:hypothetical protein
MGPMDACDPPEHLLHSLERKKRPLGPLGFSGQVGAGGPDAAYSQCAGALGRPRTRVRREGAVAPPQVPIILILVATLDVPASNISQKSASFDATNSYTSPATSLPRRRAVRVSPVQEA